MDDPHAGRRSQFRSRFALAGNGLARGGIPGTGEAAGPAWLPLPEDDPPAGIAGRVLVLEFLTPEGLAGLSPERLTVDGAAVRWLAAPDGVVAAAAADAGLDAAERTWLEALATGLQDAPGSPGRWIVALAETDLADPAVITLAQAAGDPQPGETLPGFEPGLAALTIDREGDATVWAEAPWLNAIDRVIIADRAPFVSARLRQRIILVAFENPFGVAGLGPDSVRIEGGNRITEVPVRWLLPLSGIARLGTLDDSLTATEITRLTAIETERRDAGDVDEWAVICTETRGDFSTYTLRITGDARFDGVLSAVPVALKLDCLDGFDCKPMGPIAAAPVPGPDIDYMTRDFAGFRRLMLDRLAALGAADSEQNPVGLWAMLVETLAYRMDQIAQMQDAVATEAYLHTARLRTSVRRHARALDYRMHEGVTARAWLHVAAAEGVDRADAVVAGDVLLSRIAGAAPVLPTAALEGELPEETEAFHAILPLRRLARARNRIALHAWGEDDLVLAKGATSCVLVDPGGLGLAAGDTLVLEATAGAATGLAEDADPALRHVVRLSADPVPGTDTLLDVDYLEVAWAQGDALPFDLPVLAGGRELAVARGNLLLVAHGRPAAERIRVAPWGSRGRLMAELTRPGLGWTTPAPREGDDWSATEVVRQEPSEALPDITLDPMDGGETWRPQLDLLASDRSAAEFCVETGNDGEAVLRFGDDITGRSPAADASFLASYRTGNGTAGNVGADAIAHILSDTLGAADVASVRNPLPAAGGTEPETLEAARAAAPYAFRRQERAVTLADWAEIATRSGDAQRAVARLRWTGSWHNVRVHVDPSDAVPADAAFLERTEDRLERYRLAGYGLQVVGPVYVPLDIALTVCVAPDAWPEAVVASLTAEFGSGYMPDGRRGFFHPDNFTFGDSVYLSRIVARAMAVPGVRWVDTRRANPQNRFRRWSSTAPDELETGVLRMGELEVAQCESDQSLPDNGRIAFVVEGAS